MLSKLVQTKAGQFSFFIPAQVTPQEWVVTSEFSRPSSLLTFNASGNWTKLRFDNLKSALEQNNLKQESSFVQYEIQAENSSEYVITSTNLFAHVVHMLYTCYTQLEERIH